MSIIIETYKCLCFHVHLSQRLTSESIFMWIVIVTCKYSYLYVYNYQDLLMSPCTFTTETYKWIYLYVHHYRDIQMSLSPCAASDSNRKCKKWFDLILLVLSKNAPMEICSWIEINYNLPNNRLAVTIYYDTFTLSVT